MLRVGALVIASMTSAAASPSPYIYVNRCTDGCVVTGGVDDARTQSSSILAAGSCTVGEFADDTGETGAAADAEWGQVLQCLRDVYSPYAVTVTDQLADVPAGTSYTEAIVAGLPGDVGLATVLGIAPQATTCAALDDTIVFAFANATAADGRVDNLCAIAAQQTGLVFGLDLVTGPTCDVMSYHDDCGGERFFRDEVAPCIRGACRCGPTQNAHEELLSLFGAACASATTCLTGQTCDQGRCAWAPPVGQLGDACTYDQFCVSNECASTSTGQLCTQQCLAADACPAGFDCSDGFCLPAGHSGGCDVGGTPVTPLVLLALVGVWRRRRR